MLTGVRWATGLLLAVFIIGCGSGGHQKTLVPLAPGPQPNVAPLTGGPPPSADSPTAAQQQQSDLTRQEDEALLKCEIQHAKGAPGDAEAIKSCKQRYLGAP